MHLLLIRNISYAKPFLNLFKCVQRVEDNFTGSWFRFDETIIFFKVSLRGTYYKYSHLSLLFHKKRSTFGRHLQRLLTDLISFSDSQRFCKLNNLQRHFLLDN